MTSIDEKSLAGYAEKKFGCAVSRLEEFCKRYTGDNTGYGVCSKGEHDISSENTIFCFEGGRHNLETSACVHLDCFLSGLERDTISQIDGTIQKPKKSKKHDTETPDTAEFVQMLMSQVHFLSLRDTREILYYENGIYRFGGEVLIEEMAESLVSQYTICTTSMRIEITNSIRSRTYVDRETFDADVDIINVKNGLYNIQDGTFTPHNPSYASRMQLNVEYHPGIAPKRFVSFMEEILPDIEDRTMVYEMFGAILVSRILDLQKICIFVGDGANGKSTLLKTMTDIIGVKNCSFRSMHSLIYNRFAAADLDGKLANIYADISADEMKNIGLIKNLVSGDETSVEKKNKSSFPMKNIAKMFFSCNRLPDIEDETGGVFRRFHIIEFLTEFHGGKAKARLLDELIQDSEKSGILNVLIQHAGTILKKGEFSYARDVASIRKEWKERVDMVLSFVNETVEAHPDSNIAKDRLYAEYARYCETKNERPKGQKIFSQKMSTFGYKWDKRRWEGKAQNVWIGIRFKGSVTPDDTGTVKPDTKPDGTDTKPDVSKPEISNSTMLGIVDILKPESPKQSIVDDIFTALADENGTLSQNDLVTEMVKCEKWNKEEAVRYVEELVSEKKLVTGQPSKKRWRCKCGAGPYVSGEVAFAGKPIEEYHKGDGHEIIF